MTEQQSTPAEDQAAAEARRARVAALAAGRSTRRRHPAQGARIAAAGLGATTLLGLVGAMALAEPPNSASAPADATPAQPAVVVVVHRTGTPAVVATTVAPPADSRAETTLTARTTSRPTVRQAAPRSKASAPAASTSGSH